jgi:glycerophosphoryl diester phosphodiesterase
MNDSRIGICKTVLVAAFSLALALSGRSADVAMNTLIAHRGESVDAPENTLPAFKTAVDRGFGFECDIYLSKDGRVFTFHDKDLNRTTGGANRKKCAEVCWDEISKLDVGSWGKWKGTKFAGTRPALLEEVLELARNGRYIYVEVKPGPEIVPFIKKIFDKQTKATPANTLFISFDADSCKALKQQMPEYKVYWLAGMREIKKSGKAPVEFFLSYLRQTGADGVDCQYKPEIITSEVIAAVRNAGYEFHVWTVDRLADTVEAFRRGAMTVTTNCAEQQYREFLAAKNCDKSVVK